MAFAGDVHGPAGRRAPDPAQVGQPGEQRGAERPGQVMALLAPVHAIADERAAASRGDLDPEVVDPCLAGVGEPVVAVPARRRQPVPLAVAGIEGAVAAGQYSPVDQGGHDGRAELARQVVIAGPGGAHGVRARAFPQRAHGGVRGQPGQRLEQLADVRAAESVVTVTAVRFDVEQARAGPQRRGQRLQREGRSRRHGAEGQHRPHAGGGEQPPGDRAGHRRGGDAEDQQPVMAASLQVMRVCARCRPGLARRVR